jgi:hypothetical protein
MERDATAQLATTIRATRPHAEVAQAAAPANQEETMAEEQDAKDVKRQAVRELKYLANQFKGLLAWADEAQEEVDKEKIVAELDAKIEAKKAELAAFKDLTSETAALRAEQARLDGEIASVRAKWA